MTDFGGKLRQARERKGVSLRQIATSTKISVAALEALERNDISKLPGGIFSRAFVRSYAVEVGLDPEETVREFLARFQDSPAPVAAPVRISDEESGFESQQRMATVVLMLVLISIPIVAVILYFTLRQRPAAESAAYVDTPPAAAASAPAVPGAPSTQPVAPASVGEVTRASGEMTLALHPTAPCWVTLTVDGQRILSRVMQPGEREERAVRKEAALEVGDAAACAYSINGRPGRLLGRSGEVARARITPETVADFLR